jgi:hypothetical protein
MYPHAYGRPPQSPSLYKWTNGSHKLFVLRDALKLPSSGVALQVSLRHICCLLLLSERTSNTGGMDPWSSRYTSLKRLVGSLVYMASVASLADDAHKQAETLGMDSHSISLTLPGEAGEWRVDVPMRSFQGGKCFN